MIVTYIGLAVLVVWIILCMLARKGKCGTIGAKIRASDHDAWRQAVEQRENELRDLQNMEPKL